MSTSKKVLFGLVIVVMALGVVSCKPAATETATQAPVVTQPEATTPPIATTAPTAAPVTIHIITMDQAAMSTAEEEEIARAFEAENPDIKVQWEFVGYDAVHDKIATGMSTNPPAYDAFMVDVVWPDEFIKKGYMLDVTDRITQEMKDGILPAAWLGVNRNGKTYGMPWLLDVKYFYYNTDMLKAAGFTAPPKTWEEMITMAAAMKTKGIVQYPIAWSWIQAEAAIVDFTALLFGNGGKFLDDTGKPVFNDPKGIEVLTWMKAGLDNKLFNPSSPTYKEADVETALLGGKAAFGMNWLSTYSNSNDPTLSTVVGKIALAPVPVFASTAATGLTSASCDGSSAFGVAATSPNKDAAWKFLTYLSSYAVQMKYSAKQLPIWKAAYEGDNLTALKNATAIGPVTVPAFLAQFPFANERPTVAYYNEASTALQLALQEAFSGAKTPKDALDAAAAKWVQLAGQ